MHDLSLQLPEDELPGDNQRWAAVPVKDTLLIRLVNGEPSSEPFGSEVDYLAAPLSIGVGDAEAWRVEVVRRRTSSPPGSRPADVLVLANVARPTPEQAQKLASSSGRDGAPDLHRRPSSTPACTTNGSTDRASRSCPASRPRSTRRSAAWLSTRSGPRRSRG